MSRTRVRYFTVESVSPGHPDKVLDTIAESLVDAYIDQDSNARVAIDGVVKGRILLCGEITSSANVNKEQIAKDVLKEIGYIKRSPAEISAKFNNEDLIFEEDFTEQSPDIAMGVDRYQDLKEKASGDQGMMISGAINESPNLLSHSQELAKLINFRLFDMARFGELEWARPDIKTQITTKYVDDKPHSIDTVVVSISHDESKDLEELREEIKEIVKRFVDDYVQEVGLERNDDIKWHINATGKFSIYGPQGDSGEVGRKIVCDQTGGLFPVGGGNLNGKCPWKQDRSGVYIARYAAKNIVAAGLAHKCEVNVAYCIGVKDPVSVTINTFGTNKVNEQVIEDAVKELFDFTPGGIVEKFKLISPSSERGWTYKQLGMYGHLGDPSLPWEQTDMVNELIAKVEELLKED